MLKDIFIYMEKISLLSLIYSSCTSLDFHFPLFNLSLNTFCFISNANNAAEEKGHIGKVNRAKKGIVTVINHLTRKRRGISNKEIREETRISRGRREESRWQPKTSSRRRISWTWRNDGKRALEAAGGGGEARGAAIGRAGRRGSHDDEASGFRVAPRHFVADSRLVRVSSAEQNCARRSPHDLSSSLLVRCCQVKRVTTW